MLKYLACIVISHVFVGTVIFLIIYMCVYVYNVVCVIPQHMIGYHCRDNKKKYEDKKVFRFYQGLIDLDFTQ